MSFTSKTSSTPLITTIVTDTAADLTVNQIATAAQFLYFVEISNPNASAPVYVKVIQAASNAAITSQHVLQFYCPAGTNCYYYMPDPFSIGTGLAFYCSTTKGISSGSNTLSAPSKAVTVKMGVNAQ